MNHTGATVVTPPYAGEPRRFTAILQADTLKGRFARGALWSLLGAVISQGMTLLASIASARILGKTSFGELGIIQSTVATLGVFAGMGLGLAGTRYVAELRSTDRERTGRVIGLTLNVAFGTSALASVVLIVAAPWVADATLGAAHLSRVLRVSSALLFFNAIIGAQTGVLAGFEAFRSIARVNVIRGLVSFPLCVSAVWLWKLPGAVWALAAAAAFTCWLNHAAIRSECSRNGIRLHRHDRWIERNILWTFSLPAFLSSTLPTFVIWSTSVLLVNQPGGYGELGVFSAANHWRTAVSFLPSILSQPLLAMLTNSSAQKHVHAFKGLLRANLLISAALSAGVALPLAIGSSWIMRAYGPEFAGGQSVFVLLVVVAVISSGAAVIGQAIASLNRMWAAFFLNCAWAAALLIFAQALVPERGAEGLAKSFLFSYVLHAAAVGAYAVRGLPKAWRITSKGAESRPAGSHC